MIENAIEVMIPIVALAFLVFAFIGILSLTGFVVYHVWYEVYGNHLYKYIDPIADRIKLIFKK